MAQQPTSRSSPIWRRPASDMRPGLEVLQQLSQRWPRTAFWVGRLLEQLDRPSGDSQFRLELLDPLVRSGESRILERSRSRLQTTVDAVLTTPGVKRLLGHTQIAFDVHDLAANLDQIQCPTTELQRIATSSRATLLT